MFFFAFLSNIFAREVTSKRNLKKEEKRYREKNRVKYSQIAGRG
jgi:hypothetical protein